MKRSQIKAPLVALAAIASAVEAVPAAMREEATQSRDWFNIDNKAGAKSADIYIYDEIGMWGTSARKFSNQVRDLDVEQINLHLNSPGGSVFDGVAIYNTLASHKANVTVYVDGLAASAASFIAQAGDEVVMLKGSTMMIHDASGLAWGDAKEMRKTAEILDLLSNNIAEIYAARSGDKASVWREIMKEEAWYSPDEAVAAGLADKVSLKSAPPKPAENGDNDDAEDWADWEDKFDDIVKSFNYAGRKAAPSPKMIRQTVINRLSKEAPVGTDAKNTEEPVTEPVVVEPAEGQEVVVEPAEADPAEPAEGTEEEAPAEDAESNPPEPIQGNPENAVSVVVNGVRFKVPAAVAQHVNGLEQFVTESKASAREAFVDALVSDHKIAAPQAEGLKTFVADLSDEQYKNWAATYDAAPELSMFGKHGVQDASSSAEGLTETQARIKTLQDIVQHHKNGGVKQDKLVEMNSYQELQALYKQHPDLDPANQAKS